MKTYVRQLHALGACSEALNWAEASPHQTLESAWLACERGDWMLWLVAKREVRRERIVFIACECARLALPYAKSPTVLKCIETTEAWARGEVTIEQVREARRNAAAYADTYADTNTDSNPNSDTKSV